MNFCIISLRYKKQTNQLNSLKCFLTINYLNTFYFNVNNLKKNIMGTKVNRHSPVP